MKYWTTTLNSTTFTALGLCERVDSSNDNETKISEKTEQQSY